MNTKSEIGEVNAQLRGELKERGDMDYETISRNVDELKDTLDELMAALERNGNETARPPFGRSSACNLARADGANQGDLPTVNNIFIILNSVESLTPHSQPASKTSEENAAAKENPQSGNGVKDRIWGLIGKIHVVVQTVSNSIKIWEFFQAASLIGLGMFGGS